jgi:general secretion pathway protein K
MSQTRQHSHQDSGFVLIAVAGILLLLASIAMTTMLTGRTQIKARSALNAHAEAVLIADGVARLIAFRLAQRRSTADPTSRLSVDGSLLQCREGAGLVGVQINDTAGLIDINVAPLDVIELLLLGVDVPRPEASRLAAAIQDFRDPDDVTTFGGAEAIEYKQAGRSYGPKNAPLDSVDELDQVLGMSPDLLARLLPLITVHSRASGIDPSVAPLALLHAFARAGGDLSADTSSGAREQIQLPPQVTRRPATRGSRTRLPIFIIRAHVETLTGARFMREATMELSSSSASGFIVREWRARPPQSPRLLRNDAATVACEQIR